VDGDRPSTCAPDITAKCMRTQTSPKHYERATSLMGEPLYSTAARRPFLAHERPLFFAHRGGSLLAPENTLVAFEGGVSYGADALELDIQMTLDGELVVIHDPLIDRTTNGTGPVARFTFDELRRLDAGFRFTPDGGATYPFRGQGHSIPLLREVLARFSTLRVNIDLKAADPERERRLWRLIQESAAEERVMVGSFLHASLVRFRRLTGGRVATSASQREIVRYLVAVASRTTRLLRPAYDALQVPEKHRGVRVVSPALIAAAHRLGLDVHVWTVDERTDMERLLTWGVDGLMTDRPDVLAQVLRTVG
jgi:glycerophosphoryl diester phosphodiesterase